MDDRDDIERTSAKTRLEEHLRYVQGYKKSVNASVKFAALFGAPLPDDVVLVLIHSLEDQVLRISPSGTADTNSPGIGNGDWFPCYGKKDTLDLYEIWTGAATNYEFFVYARIEGAE